MARFIVIPETPDGLIQQLTFATWLGWYCDSEPRLQKPHTAARAAQRMLEAADKVAAGVIELRDEDHERLSKLLLNEQEPPECGLAPSLQLPNGQGRALPARLVLPYIDAIANATSERPA